MCVAVDFSDVISVNASAHDVATTAVSSLLSCRLTTKTNTNNNNNTNMILSTQLHTGMHTCIHPNKHYYRQHRWYRRCAECSCYPVCCCLLLSLIITPRRWDIVACCLHARNLTQKHTYKHVNVF